MALSSILKKSQDDEEENDNPFTPQSKSYLDSADDSNDDDDSDDDSDNNADDSSDDNDSDDEEQDFSSTQKALSGVTPQEAPRLTSTFEDVYKNLQGQEAGPRAKEYANYVIKAPRREDYKPGKLNRLGAMLAGSAEGIRNPAQGVQLTRQMLEAPYQRALTDWTIKGKGLEKAAELEEKESGRKVGLAKIIAQDVHNTKTEQLRQADIDYKLKALDEKSKVNMQRALRLGMKYQVDKTTGKAYFVIPQFDDDGSPLDPLRVDAGKVDESIPEKAKSAIEKFTQQQKVIEGRQSRVEGQRLKGQRENQSAKSKEEAENATNLENLRQGNRIAIETKRVQGRKDVKGTPTAAQNKPLSPNQLKNDHLNKMSEIYSQNLNNPKTNIKLYFNVDSKGNPTSLKENGIISRLKGYNEKTYNDIYNYVYGSKEEEQ